MSPSGIQAGGTLHRLPEGASAIAAPPVLRPLPGGGGRLLVGLLGASAVPAWVLPGAARPAAAWVLVPDPEGALLLGGDALADAPPGAPPVPPPAYPAPRIRLARAGGADAAAPSSAPSRGGFRLILPRADAGGCGEVAPGSSASPRIASRAAGPSPVLDIPFGALARLVPMPLLHPAPDAPPPALGLAWTGAGPVLVLDPTPFGGEAGEAPLLAILLSEGRQLGLPCRGATPIPAAVPLPPPLSQPALLAAAPLGRLPEMPPPAPTRLLLVARASGAGFALPLEEVTTVLAPQRPLSCGAGALAGIAAHRGDVLPVLDAGARLGQAPVLGTGQPVPMLRLTGTHHGGQSAALAVSSVTGLRAVPEADVAPVAGDGLVAAVLRLDGAPLPVLRARALLGALAGAAGTGPQQGPAA